MGSANLTFHFSVTSYSGAELDLQIGFSGASIHKNDPMTLALCHVADIVNVNMRAKV